MILIGLGANLDSRYGSPEETLKACGALFHDRGIHIIQSSNLWRSAPVPVSDQPWYYNAVCCVRTSLNATELLRAIAEIEAFVGRQRRGRNAARVIDLDLLDYNNELLESPDLILPHPRMHERSFVLYPLQEIAPFWIHPVLDLNVEAMIEAIPEGQEIECIKDSAFSCVV